MLLGEIIKKSCLIAHRDINHPGPLGTGPHGPAPNSSQLSPWDRPGGAGRSVSREGGGDPETKRRERETEAQGRSRMEHSRGDPRAEGDLRYAD